MPATIRSLPAMSSPAASFTAPLPASPVTLFSISPRQWLILLTVQLSTLLFGMTITLANVVLPQVRGTLSATQDEIAWVITLNLVATAVATPMTGWLASRLGWRNVMFFGVLGFTLCSLMCGLADSLETLVLYRVGQGLFGAPIMPLGQGIVLATFMIVPPGLVALVCIWFALSEHRQGTATRLDWTGFIALSVAITALQLMIDRGQRLDWFESPEIVIDAVVAAIAFWIFAAHSLTAERPFLDPKLLLDRNFSIGLVIAFFMGMLSYTSLVLFPSLLHDLRDYPDSTIGMLLAARGTGNWIAFLVVVPFSRRYPRLAVSSGLLSQAVAGWAMAQLDINLSSFDVFWTNALQGFGFGLAYTPMTVLAFATLPAHQLTEGSGVFTLVRNFGSSLYISITVVLLVRSTTANYARMTEFVTPFNRTLAFPGLPGAWSLDTASGLMRLAGEIQRQASMIGYINAFHLLALTAAVATPLVWLMRGAPRLR